jgi:hypothetical protein
LSGWLTTGQYMPSLGPLVQSGQRAWNRANPIPLTDERQRALTAEFVKTYAKAARA